MLFSSWRTNVKLAWGLPRNCEKFIVEHLAPSLTPPKVGLLSRFHKFFHGLLNSPSPEVEILARLSARDLRTNIGRNLSYIYNETGLNPWEFGTSRIRSELKRKYRVVPDTCDLWRLPYLDKLLSQRLEAFYCGDTEGEKQIDKLIHSLVAS